MTEAEVICLENIPTSDYNRMVIQAIRYALLSKPFTIKRVEGLPVADRILNIFKGKLAEQLFAWYSTQHVTDADWESCTTPFYQTDKRDFIWKGIEWDIKNNYIYHAGVNLTDYGYTQLPALVPNRHGGDQWAKRTELKNPGKAKATGFIFTFLKGASLHNGKRSDDFCKLMLSESQLQTMEQLEIQFGGNPVAAMPFEPSWLWDKLQFHPNDNIIRMQYYPKLCIAGYALVQHENLFKNTGPGDAQNQWMDYLPAGWYSKTHKGSCNFLHGTLWTTLTNATVPVGLLPSFQNLL